MKTRTYLALPLIVLLLAGVMALYAVAQAPEGVAPQPRAKAIRGAPMVDQRANPRIGITQINSSTVNYVQPDTLLAGLPVDLCFNVTVESPDLEYMDLLEIDLPDDWTVTEVYTMPDSGCGSGVITGIDPVNLISWSTDAPLPSGCGAWSNGTYDFCANVTLPDCSGAPWSLPWYIQGDWYGNPPHTVSGTTDPVYCLAGLILAPETIAVEGCHTLSQTHALNLRNKTGAEGTFSLTYNVPSGNGTLTGPDNIYLGDGVDQDFIVELAPYECLSDGTVVTATIEASGGGHSDSSTIVKTIRDAPECPVCTPPSLTLTPETISVEGCAGVTQTHTLNLLNHTRAEGTFSLSYDVPGRNGTLTGPDQIYLGDGVGQDLLVELRPDLCLRDGTLVTGTIDATGNGASDSSVIVHTIRDWPTCPECPLSYAYLPLVVRSP